MENENKGIWIPFEIWELADLSPMQRILLAKIHALSQKDGACWAGDEFLAEALVCTPQYIRKMRKDLCETEHISCEGYGHRRKMTVLVKATTVASNDWNKQPQLQELQQSLQVEATTVAKVATTVAQSIEPTIDYTKEQVKSRRFKAPTLQECMERFEEAGSSADEGEKFFNFYESKGWMIGRNKMKDWNAAARNWIKRNNDERQKTSNKTSPSRDEFDNYIRHGII